MCIYILRRLRNVVGRKRPGKRKSHRWFLLYDNAPAHQSILVKDFLAKNDVTTLELLCTLHSPDLTPADIYLFPRLKWQ